MKFLNWILSILIIVTYFYFVYLLYDIGFLSGKLEILLVVFLAIIILFIVIFMIKKHKILKIISYFLYVVLLLIMLAGIYYLNPTKKFIDSFDNSNKTDYNNFYVVVPKTSKYTKLSELKGKKIATCETIEDEVIEKININYDERKFSSCEEVNDALFDDSVSAAILSDVSIYLINEINNEFEDKVRVIYKVSIPKEVKEDDEEEVDTNTPFVLFISGIDTSGKISKVSRSDVNILVTVNPNEKEVLLTTIPRDYYVQLHGTSGYKDKLTHAGIYGIDKSILTIEDLLNIDINYYVRVNFDTVINLVDKIGGITIYSDQNLRFCNIKKGYNDLDGKCALRFARERHSYQTGDRHRGENQEEVIRSIIEKVSSSSVLLTKYNSIINDLQDNFETNVSSNLIKAYIKMQVKEMPKWTVKNLNLNGYDSRNYTYSYRGSMLYVMEPDINTVNKASEAINGILQGKTFAELEL